MYIRRTDKEKTMAYPLDRFLISRCTQYPHVVKEFIRFLMMNNIYGKYVLNYANAPDHWKHSYHFEGDTPKELSINAFLWDQTPEGYKYWKTIDKMWRSKLKYDLNIKI